MSHNFQINLWQTSRKRWKEKKWYSKRHRVSTYSPWNSQLRTEGRLTRSTLGIELNNLLSMCVKFYTLIERRKENKIPRFECLIQVFQMHACLSLCTSEGQEGIWCRGSSSITFHLIFFQKVLSPIGWTAYSREFEVSASLRFSSARITTRPAFT